MLEISQMKQKLVNGIRNIVINDDMDDSEKITILQSLIDDTIGYIAEEIKKKPLINSRKVAIGDVTEKEGVGYGIKRFEETIIFGNWLFELRQTTQNNILTFLVVKESFMHFFEAQINELFETIINFLAILLLHEYFNIKSIENNMLVEIRRYIYPESIAGRDYMFFIALLNLLVVKKVSYKDVYKKFLEFIKDQKIDETSFVNQFSRWVFTNTIRDEDVIAPILIKNKLIPIIDFFTKYGYDESKASAIAEKLNVHDNTVRYYVRELSSSYVTFWKANINYEKLKLHNYYLKVIVNDNNTFDQILNQLLKIPYVVRVFTGQSKDDKIIYSPAFISPHIVADTFSDKLQRYKNKNLIKDYNLQLIQEKLHYATITSSKTKLFTNPAMKTFTKLFEENHSELPIKKYLFSHEHRDNSPIISDEIPLDYNLLYFLSFLSQKYILGGNYGGWIRELPKLYELNTIESTDVGKAVDFLNQIEIRARRREILSFSLHIRGYTNRGRNVLVFETPYIDSEKEATRIIDRLRIFQFLGHFHLHNRFIFIIPGISHEHPVKKLIAKTLEKEGIESSFYTINLYNSRFVPLHDLYDYDAQKWL